MGIESIVIGRNDKSPSTEGLCVDPSPVCIALEVMQGRRHPPMSKDRIRCFMVESFIGEGSQKVMENGYGKSLANPCLGWKDSEKLIGDLAEMV